MIDLTHENYKQYLPLDIVAFSFAFGGAMGDGGGVVIIDKKGQRYYFNYAYGEEQWTEEEMNEILPMLPECHFPIFGPYAEMPEGYSFRSLGYGNNLVLTNEMDEKLQTRWEKELEGQTFDVPEEVILYGRWFDLVMEILEDEGVPR